LRKPKTIMIRSEYVKVCGTCLNKEFDSQKGIICNLTNEIANFEEKCPDYLTDGKSAQKALGSQIYKKGEELEKAEDVKNSTDDMIYGALWCIGGAVATLFDFGLIFWGAILFGGIQFLKGLINSLKN